MNVACTFVFSTCILLCIAVVINGLLQEDDGDALSQVLRNVDYPGKDASPSGTGCRCLSYNCGCCVYMNVPEIKLKDTACVNLTYLPKEYGISVTITIDKFVLLNTTLSARNPPPLCLGIPGLEKEASLCLDFYDLDISKKSFSGCLRFEVTLLHIPVANIKIGCFEIPLGDKNSTDPIKVEEMRRWLDAIKVLTQEKRRAMAMKEIHV